MSSFSVKFDDKESPECDGKKPTFAMSVVQDIELSFCNKQCNEMEQVSLQETHLDIDDH